MRDILRKLLFSCFYTKDQMWVEFFFTLKVRFDSLCLRNLSSSPPPIPLHDNKKIGSVRDDHSTFYFLKVLALLISY